jgi:hypothetical protein
MNWTDVNGSQTGNLAFFDAHADLASVSFVDISGQSLTALSGLAALPALTHLECSSDSLTTLDISGNPLLTEVHANATSLTTLDISSNPLLTTVDLQSCNLTTAEVNAILAQLVASGQTGGTVYLQAQASLAPPSAGPPNGIAAAAALLAESPPWMVNTDVGLHSTATAWAARVVTNGGAAPSSPTIAALSDFAYALDAAGLTSLMIAVNCLVPDNLIAAYTPLIVGGGRDPWLAHNFYPGYLSVNGLAGDRGSATYLQTGIIPSTVYGSVNDAGLSVYVWSNTYYGARREIAATPSDGSSSALLCCYNGTAYWDAYTDGGTGRVSYSSAGNPEGFFSGSRTDSSHEYLYFANSGNAFAQKAGPGGAPGATLPNIEYYAFAQNNNGSPADSVSGSLSFIAIHHGLTSAQSQDFYNAVQAMRTSLGGGYR